MKSMLDRAMEREITEDEAANLKAEFGERLTYLYNLFDGTPFTLPPDDKGRVRISATIYDAAMVAINDLWNRKDEIFQDAEAVRNRMLEAMGDETKITTLTGQGNTAKAVKDRIDLMRNIFRPE